MNKRRIRTNKAVKTFAVVVLVGIALASTTSATILGTVNIQNHNNALSDIGQLWGGGLNGGFYFTGIYSWTNAGGTGLGTQVPDWGFCIELTQGATNGISDVIPLNEAPLPPMPSYGTPMGITKANYIRELWGRFFDPAWLTGGTANKQMAEAFGAAVWEIIYETDPVWNVSNGAGFHASYIEQANIANNWLSQLNGDKAYFAKDLYAISPSEGAYGQDYLVQLPEPATICMLSLGALSLIRRKQSV